jgi:hypothetical protein
MSENTNNNNSEEEVDLGPLFTIIGKACSTLFNFIANIFKGIFHGIILGLLFFKKNAIKIAIAAVIGGVLGMFLEVRKTTIYGSDLLVQPNFESARQLYKTVNYYNELVSQKDIVAIKKEFSLDSASAASLKKFIISPVKIENNIISAYNRLVLSVDTLAIKSYLYKDFKASFTDFDYKVHKITVVAEKNNVFEVLDSVIISSVVGNKYFNRLKVLSNENLNRTDSLLRQNLGQVDSLRNIYMQVLLEEAKKQSSGTNIDLGSNKAKTKELELFATSRKINSELRSIASEKSTKYEVINVISNFQPVGYKIKGITKNYVFLFAVFAAGFMVFSLLFLQLNGYLNNYKKTTL